MYKLKVIAGPNRGSVFSLQEGETSIGRQSGNTIVLPSAKVSKRHCTLTVSGDNVMLRDQGSSNGTFVNGVLAKMRRVVPGERISVGDYVLELAKPAVPALASSGAVPALSGLGGAIQSPVSSPSATGGPDGLTGMANAGTLGGQQMPTDLKGKIVWYFDRYVMPFFYGLILQREWRLVAGGLFAAFVLTNLVVTVYPLMQSSNEALIRETAKRAKFMAREIVDRNTPALAARAETKTEIGSIEREEGVRVAVLTDLDNRILAPGSRMNQYLNGGAEAKFAIDMKQRFQEGEERGRVHLGDSLVIAVEPVKILNPQAGKNVVVGMAVVSIDTSLSTPGMGETGMAYAETLILTGLIGGIILFILYRLTLKPFQVLNDDIDKVLKGDMGQITREFKFEEIGQLLDVIDSALQRVPKGGAPGDGLGMSSGPSAEDIIGSVQMFGDIGKFGLVVLDGDRKIVHMNSMFEEISGIRLDNAMGQELGMVARDQALGPFSQDLMARAPVGGRGVSEDYEFSGIGYKVFATAFGASGGAAKCYAIAAVKNDG